MALFFGLIRSLLSARLLAPILAAGLIVGACGGASNSIQTYTDPSRLSRFDLPEAWHVYELSELSGLDDLPFDEAFDGFTFPAVTSVGFDGAPVRNVGTVATDLSEAEYPIGAASVRQVGEVERDILSRAILTQSVVPYYQLANSEELTKEDFSFGDGYDGVRVLFAFQNDTGTEQGVAYMISVTDDEDRRIFSIVAGCNRECFIANQEVIVNVVDSWLVNKKA